MFNGSEKEKHFDASSKRGGHKYGERNFRGRGRR
jgi:hypothetical protein